MSRSFVYQDVPLSIKTLQVVGITASAFLAGQQASLTYIATPALLLSPAPLLVKQWKKAFDTTSAVEPITSLGLGALFGYLAYRQSSISTSAFKLYATAAILLPAALPYTVLLVRPINLKLLQKSESLANSSITDVAAEIGVTREETAHALVDKWATLHLGRALLSAIAAVSATWAVLATTSTTNL